MCGVTSVLERMAAFMNSLIHSLAIALHGEKTGMQLEGWRPILSFAGVVIHNDSVVLFYTCLIQLRRDIQAIFCRGSVVL